MVLRPDAVHERLAKLEEVVSHLEQLGRLDASTLRLNFRDAWLAERGLQLGAEVILDVSNHVISSHFGITSKDYEDILSQLAACGVIDDSLRQRLKGLGGFRNILVHGYLRLDPDRVAEMLARAPRDFTDFAIAVRHWLGTIDSD